MKKILGIIFVLIICLFPTDAFGAVTGISFGGKVFTYAPCTCTGGSVYYIVVGPPSGPITLSYVAGTQAFSKYTLPIGRQILGLYNPFGAATCYMGVTPYCTVFPTAGLIMPMVGSSI